MLSKMASYNRAYAACSPHLNYSTEDDLFVHKSLAGKLQIYWGAGSGNPVFYLPPLASFSSMMFNLVTEAWRQNTSLKRANGVKLF